MKQDGYVSLLFDKLDVTPEHKHKFTQTNELEVSQNRNVDNMKVLTTRAPKNQPVVLLCRYMAFKKTATAY